MQIVAIGGSASVGKTTAATVVARHLGADTVIHVDDISRGLRATTPHPIDGFDAPWGRPPSELVAELVEWTANLHAPITAAADRLRSVGGVIEGEGVDPRLGFGRAGPVRPVYVIEDDRDRLRATFESRPSSERFVALTRPEQDAVVEMNLRYGRWLRAAADAAGEPWVASQPWGTLPERILASVPGIA